MYYSPSSVYRMAAYTADGWLQPGSVRRGDAVVGGDVRRHFVLPFTVAIEEGKTVQPVWTLKDNLPRSVLEVQEVQDRMRPYVDVLLLDVVRNAYQRSIVF